MLMTVSRVTFGDLANMLGCVLVDRHRRLLIRYRFFESRVTKSSSMRPAAAHTALGSADSSSCNKLRSIMQSINRKRSFTGTLRSRSIPFAFAQAPFLLSACSARVGHHHDDAATQTHAAFQRPNAGFCGVETIILISGNRIAH
ncbi:MULTISPECIES: hypothetical protein [unclassified Bradyrhizobium]|uniref:hypothetical protein n=1 Tax=unclassified Bradyrhizobium TaxID=2631580 RepID=UPI001FFA702F|nr:MULTISPECIES: hypothetical protein [unclassified Bradyrhizobium]MCK1712099.1 hypothetical protein [Bradyrhizobium sp. 143]MCK1732075.1 hypothetical protein [Bradyrhizobium sp. 142]